MKPTAPIILGLLVSACASTPPVVAQDPGPEEDRTLEVSAVATATRSPDRAAVRFAVETPAGTAQDAMDGNARSMNALISALEELGIARDEIQTQSVSLQPRYRREPGQEPEITGYTASNQIEVPVGDVDRVGEVIDAGVSAGANRVLGIRFEISDPEAAYHEALERAIGQARREAEVIASAMGESLGPALRVTTSGLATPAPQSDAVQLMARAESTPIQPGQLDVRASVRIVYRLGR